MPINISLRHLHAFLAVAQTRSFSAAAIRINLSQPALSATIRKLEDIIGARLFDRTTRNVVLTPVGTEVLGFAERLLSDFDGAFAGVRAFVSGGRGRIAIAASPSLAAGFLPEVLAAFRQSHPGIEVKIHDALSDVCVDMVRAGRVDIALVPDQTANSDLNQQELLRDYLILLCRGDHPLAKSRSVTWESIAPHDMVSIANTSSIRQHVEAVYANQGKPLRPAFEVEQASTLISFVAHGLGVGVMPHSLAPLAGMSGLVHKRILDPEIHRVLSAATLKTRPLSPASQAFIDECLKRAALRRNAPMAKARQKRAKA